MILWSLEDPLLFEEPLVVPMKHHRDMVLQQQLGVNNPFVLLVTICTNYS